MKKQSRNLKTLSPALLEIGKIKIGRKGQTKKTASGSTFQMPEKLDYFLVTTLERDKSNNFEKDKEIHKIIGEKPKRIPIMLLFNSIEGNFQSRFSRYNGKTCECSGDGETAICNGEEIECPCGKEDPEYTGKDKCKMNGTLSVMIRDAKKFGSCWKLRTTGFHSITNIYSSLLLIQSMTKGQLAGIYLELVLAEKTAVNPLTKKPVKIWVVGVEFDGSLEKLVTTANELKKIAPQEVGDQKLIEGEVPNLIDDEDFDAEDHIEEFYPEQAEGFVEEVVDEETGEVTEQAVDVQDTLDAGSIEEAVDAEPLPEIVPPKPRTNSKNKLTF